MRKFQIQSIQVFKKGIGKRNTLESFHKLKPRDFQREEDEWQENGVLLKRKATHPSYKG